MESEINNSITEQNRNDNTNIQFQNQNKERKNSNGYSSKNSSAGATPKQLKYLSDLAKKKNINLFACIRDFGYTKLEELGFDECSTLINKFKSIKAA